VDLSDAKTGKSRGVHANPLSVGIVLSLVAPLVVSLGAYLRDRQRAWARAVGRVAWAECVCARRASGPCRENGFHVLAFLEML
jgi:hypothetical protein